MRAPRDEIMRYYTHFPKVVSEKFDTRNEIDRRTSERMEQIGNEGSKLKKNKNDNTEEDQLNVSLIRKNV